MSEETYYWRIYECQNNDCKARYLGTDQDYHCIYCEYRRTNVLASGTIVLGDENE